MGLFKTPWRSSKTINWLFLHYFLQLMPVGLVWKSAPKINENLVNQKYATLSLSPYARTKSKEKNAIFWNPRSLRNIKMLPSKAFLINFQSISLHWICQGLGIAGQNYNKGQVISEYLKKQCKKLTNFSRLVSKKWLNHKIKALFL